MPPLLILLLLLSAAVATKVHHSSSFSLDFFPGDGAIAHLALSDANATSSGAISMRSPHSRVHYHKPIHFAAGFSTYFSFSLKPAPSPTGPKLESSLAFFLATPAAPKTDALLAVVFFAGADADPTHIQVRIDLAAADTRPAATIPLPRAQKLHSWIDYNATSAKLHVRLSASRVPKPLHPLLSYPLHLDTHLHGRRNNPMLAVAGFASQAANCTLFSWAFRADPYLMHSQPLDPTGLLNTPPQVRLHSDHPRYRYPSWVSLLFAAACGAILTFFLLFAWFSVGGRRPVAVAPVDPSDEKVVLVGVKDDAHVAMAAAGNK